MASQKIEPKDSVGFIEIDFGTDFLNWLSLGAPPSAYKNDTTFTDYFKGLYITTGYGSSSMLYVSGMSIQLFHKRESQGSGNDLEETAIYPASKEVRQVNSIEVKDEYVRKIPDSLHLQLIQTPAAMLAKVNIPLRRMKESMNDSIAGKRMNINSALVAVEVEVDTVNTTLLAPPAYMLMVRESEFEGFFEDNKLPNDSTSVLGIYNSSSMAYVFDLSKYLSNEFKKNDVREFDELVLVPVSVTVSGTSILSVEHTLRLQAMTIRTEKHRSPLRIRTIFSGF